MRSTFRVLLMSAGFSLVGVGCLPCDTGPAAPQSVCHVADAGEITPDASFVLEVDVPVQGQCTVGIDGGQIDLTVSGVACSGAPTNGVRAPGFTARCFVPPLAAGNYTVNSQVASGFTVAAMGDAGIRRCP